MRILVMGLPGAGKTTLSKQLSARLNAAHFEANAVRQQHNDWDFSKLGRMRQARRMRNLCDAALDQDHCQYAVADFVCPIPETRIIFDAHFTVWVNTVDECVYADTTDLFIPPMRVDYRLDRHTDPELTVARLLELIEKKQSQ